MSGTRRSATPTARTGIPASGSWRCPPARSCRPDCGLPTDLGGVNDWQAGTVSAEVDLPAAAPAAATQKKRTPADDGISALAGGDVILALAAAPSSSDTGDFSQTPFSSRRTSGRPARRSGDFSWTYDLDVPPVPGDLDPEVSLVLLLRRGRRPDRRRQCTARHGWARAGAFRPASSSARYRTCSRRRTAHAPAYDQRDRADQCWRLPNARIWCWSGRSTQLIPGADGDLAARGRRRRQGGAVSTRRRHTRRQRRALEGHHASTAPSTSSA